jgi:S1-C subfamily serine protease
MAFSFNLDSLPSRVPSPMRMKLMDGPLMFALGSPLADLELAPLNPDLGRYFGATDGILVISLPPESGLGLKGGDVILAVDGRTPASTAQLLRILRSYEPGQEVKLEIMRDKRRQVVVGRIGER